MFPQGLCSWKARLWLSLVYVQQHLQGIGLKDIGHKHIGLWEALLWKLHTPELQPVKGVSNREMEVTLWHEFFVNKWALEIVYTWEIIGFKKKQDMFATDMKL